MSRLSDLTEFRPTRTKNNEVLKMMGDKLATIEESDVKRLYIRITPVTKSTHLPVNPVAPGDPVNPLMPTGPVLPTGPGGPVGPVCPVNPAVPMTPWLPEEPVSPSGPGRPVPPVAPTSKHPQVLLKLHQHVETKK